MAQRLESIEADEDEVARLGNGNNLPPTALAVLGALDDTWGQRKEWWWGWGVRGLGGGATAAARLELRRFRQICCFYTHPGKSSS